MAIVSHRAPRVPVSRRPRKGRWLFAGILALVAVLALEWQPALALVGSTLIDSQAPRPADLILVLGGDFWGARVIKGAELGRLGYAPMVLISSPPYAGRPEGELAVAFLVKRGYPRQEFAVFAHNAASTIAEAGALRGELARRHAKNVILVTSAYHSRRAAIVFTLFCPGIHFISAPADDGHYHAERWWKEDGSRELFFGEYVKIFGTLAVAYPTYLVTRLVSWLTAHHLVHARQAQAVEQRAQRFIPLAPRQRLTAARPDYARVIWHTGMCWR